MCPIGTAVEAVFVLHGPGSPGDAENYPKPGLPLQGSGRVLTSLCLPSDELWFSPPKRDTFRDTCPKNSLFVTAPETADPLSIRVCGRLRTWRKGWDYPAPLALRFTLRLLVWRSAPGSRTPFSSHGYPFDSRCELAEGVGFEPTVGLTLRSISSRVPSTGLSHPSMNAPGIFSGEKTGGSFVYKRFEV